MLKIIWQERARLGDFTSGFPKGYRILIEGGMFFFRDNDVTTKIVTVDSDHEQFIDVVIDNDEGVILTSIYEFTDYDVIGFDEWQIQQVISISNIIDYHCMEVILANDSNDAYRQLESWLNLGNLTIDEMKKELRINDMRFIRIEHE